LQGKAEDAQAMSAAVKAHGMDGTLVEPDWPPLTHAEVRALLSEFSDCGEPIRILWVSPRPLSAACVVEAGGRRVFIKRHHRTVRSREELLEEHRFMNHLHVHGAPVPLVYAATSGETAIEIGEWTYEVHEAFTGDIYEDALSWTPFRSNAHAYFAGQALAGLHLAAQGFDASRRKAQLLVASFTIFAAEDPGKELRRYLAARPALNDYLLRRGVCNEALDLLAPFHAQLLPLLPALPPLWTHNDLHGSNLFWSDAGNEARVAAIVDFGLSDRSNAVHDLAIAIERNIVEWLFQKSNAPHEDAPVHLDQLHMLLAGYESLRPLSDEEAAALVPMTALCHAEFALSEADYFLSVLHSEMNTRRACEDYLVGHARWFHGAGGKKLLQALDRWTETRRQESAHLGAGA
jgi:Ser/Thr protein kinase RdoA (MazF antagonist)